MPIFPPLRLGKIKASALAVLPPANHATVSKPIQKGVRIAKEDEDCRKELSFWGEKATTAAMFTCPRHIERMARYDYEWTDGFLGAKFSHYRWRDIDNGIVTVIGDKIKFQNGFGAWSNMIYECDIAPKTNLILDVRAADGRL